MSSKNNISLNDTLAAQSDLLIYMSKTKQHVFVNHQNEIVFYAEIEAGQTMEWLDFAFQKVKIITAVENFCVMPKALFEEENTAHLFQYLKVNPEQVVRYHHFTNHDFAITYIAKHENWLQNIEKKQADVEIWDEVSSFLNLHQTENGLLINFQQYSFTALYFENEGLKFAKNFNFSNQQEIHYFLNLLLSQLKIKDQSSIILSGNIHPEDEIVKALSAKYQVEIDHKLPENLDLTLLNTTEQLIFAQLFQDWVCV